jgi:transposase
METGGGMSKAPNWRVSDELWERVEPLLPKYRVWRVGGRPRVDRRMVLDGILYVLRTGCQWKAAPSEFGSPSTLHRYFQEWTKKGVFFRLWKEALREYDALEGIDWGWQSLDGAMTKAPLGGEKNRPQPDGPRQVRHQAFPSYGWRRRSSGGRHRGGQRA